MRTNFQRLRSIIAEALKNAFQVLGLPPTASDDEIRKAWRKLALTAHPDRGGSHGDLVDINKASDHLLSTDQVVRKSSFFNPNFKGFESGHRPNEETSKPPIPKEASVQLHRCQWCGRDVAGQVAYGGPTLVNHYTTKGGSTKCQGSGKHANAKKADDSSATGNVRVCPVCGSRFRCVVDPTTGAESFPIHGDSMKCSGSRKPVSPATSNQKPPSSGHAASNPNTPPGTPPPPDPSTTDRQYFTHEKVGIRDYWEVSNVKDTYALMFRWGTIGTTGYEASKDYDSSAMRASSRAYAIRAKMSQGYVDATPAREREAAGTPPPPAPAGARPADAAAGRKTKDSYKVYPWRGQRRVVRIGGKLYGTGEGGRLKDGGTTRFNSGERANVSKDGTRLKVTKSDSDHTQTWDPIDEVRHAVDELLIEMFARIGRQRQNS